jgi:hypothetical protein
MQPLPEDLRAPIPKLYEQRIVKTEEIQVYTEFIFPTSD